MSDYRFVDVGDELVVRVSGYPVGKAYVFEVSDMVKCRLYYGQGKAVVFTLPLDFIKESGVDGVGHE